MLTLRPAPQQQAPSKLKYRFRRFLFSKTYWAISRLVLPLAVIAFVGYQVFTSQALRDGFDETKTAVVNWVAFLPGLKIENLTITNATKLQEDEILQALDVSMPNSTILIDRDELREKMSSFDEVGEASFRFGFNGYLYIELQPRVPEMIYFDGNEMITIDHSGHRVELLQDRKDRAELFVISGEGAVEASEEALEIIHSLKPYSSKIRGLVRVGARRWDIILVNDARLMLPAKEPLKALFVILQEHQRNDVLNRDIKAYDMRNPERPILRLPQGAIEEMKAVAAKDDLGQEV